MYELIQAGECSYYIDCPAKIGVYKASENGVYLIDSGGDKDAGRRIKKVMDAQGWTVRGIVNTHAHADHTGGNAYLQKQYGCKAFARGAEAAIGRNPELEPALLYGGRPYAELRGKFLLAQPSEIFDATDPDFPAELELIPLPGHYFDMCAVRTPDGTLFMADCVSSPETLAKYRVSYIYDVEKYLQTLYDIENLRAPLFVPAHAPVCTDMGELARVNRAAVLEIADAVLELCREGLDFERLLKAVFDRFGLHMTYQQYILVGSTLRSYLSWLKDGGRVRAEIYDNMLVWKTAENG
ncbi:MAG: MBL fold metallo-hydrolase [Butyricicoccus sp.]|nr:MBL fold metallo-hydrolase [Butyricicoccus sp.]